MQLTVNNHKQLFIPLQSFRLRWGLPLDFNVARFESKDWEGLGSIEGARQALIEVKAHVIDAIPAVITLSDLLNQVDTLSRLFRRELELINRQIRLRPPEVDFAVAGFEDLLQAVSYHLIQLVHTSQGDMEQVRHEFDFSAIYQTWLDDSVRVSSTAHTYINAGTRFDVRVVHTAFGRVGLEVRAPDGADYYVTDMSLACPASRYMEALSRQVAEALCAALTGPVVGP